MGERPAARPPESTVSPELHLKRLIASVAERSMTRPQAIMAVTPDHVARLVSPQFVTTSKEQANTDRRLFTTGIAASYGAASGVVVFDSERAQRLKAEVENVILVRSETTAEDVPGILAADGVLTTTGT